jgi:Mrp family chromosome partitioning ATPase
MAGSLPAGLLLGLLIALLSEGFGGARAAAPARTAPGVAPVAVRQRRPFRAPQPAMAGLQPFAGAPVLAQIPNALDARAADYVIDYPMSAFAQSLSEVAGHLAQQGTRVVAITSAQHGEGKTAIAVALARAAARRGMRTVLIDCDLKRPQAAQAMGIFAVQAGIYEATAGTQPLSRCLYKDPRSNALLLSTPRPLREPHMLLNSPAMQALVSHLANSADLVIVDAAPALTSEDTPASAALSDAVLMVARNERPEVSGAIDAMQNRGAPPIGVLLAS